MAITMRDRFLIRASIDDVWGFLTDPHRVVVCMPGAQLERVESDRAFLGSFRLAVGPFSTSYKGRVEFAELDESQHKARLTAEGQERGGGPAQGAMVSSLKTVKEGTEVVVDLSVDGANRIVEMGLGLTQNVAEELFGQFVTCVRERLEMPAGATSNAGDSTGGAAVQVVPLLAKAFMRRFNAKRSPDA